MSKVEQLKAALKEKGVKFHPRHGLESLQKLAEENGVVVQKVIKGSVVPAHYKKDYGPSQSCGDEIAEIMKAETCDEKGKADRAALIRIADANGIPHDRWAHLNVGMFRMNLSNVLRGKVKRNEQVVIGKHKLGTAA